MRAVVEHQKRHSVREMDRDIVVIRPCCRCGDGKSRRRVVVRQRTRHSGVQPRGRGDEEGVCLCRVMCE